MNVVALILGNSSRSTKRRSRSSCIKLYTHQERMSQVHSLTFNANRTRRLPFPSTTDQATMKNRSHEASPNGGVKSSCQAEMQQSKVASQHGSEKTILTSAEWGRSSLILLFGILMMLSPDTKAQQIGVDICACQPSVYEFTFDFLNTCDDFNVTGPGISDNACFVDFAADLNVTDEVPVAVTRIEILELDQILQVVAQTQIVGNFRTGDIL
jgi:hypothetical protein